MSNFKPKNLGLRADKIRVFGFEKAPGYLSWFSGSVKPWRQHSCHILSAQI